MNREIHRCEEKNSGENKRSVRESLGGD